jgi:hypothetical protein
MLWDPFHQSARAATVLPRVAVLGDAQPPIRLATAIRDNQEICYEQTLDQCSGVRDHCAWSIERSIE